MNRIALLTLLVCGIIGVGIVVVVRSLNPPAASAPVTNHQTLPDDPRLVYPTPFRNVKPSVTYVGDAACATCHPSIDKAFHAHPMGRSADWVATSKPIERFDKAAHNPTVRGEYTLTVDHQPTGTVHRISTPLGECRMTSDLAIGSGALGRSYITNENGTLWQTPISWYSPNSALREGRWDVSPGFDLEMRMRRPILTACLFCHVDRVEPIAGSFNRFREPILAKQASIGCERCHGPGSLHVDERISTPMVTLPDTSIVNPKHLSPSLQHSICEQCHLQGQARIPHPGRNEFDFRPGLPFEEFVTVFVRNPDLQDLRQSVGQFEQMQVSRCFTGTEGKLVCTSCHDPHEMPTAAKRDEHFRARCNTCHSTRGCTAPAAERAAQRESCITCHMPHNESSNIIHASVTDHRVLRKPTPAKRLRGIGIADQPIVPYHEGARAVKGPILDRAYGKALLDTSSSAPQTHQSLIVQSALKRLEPIVKLWPDDAIGRHAYLTALRRLGRATDAYREGMELSQRFPDSEPILEEFISNAVGAGQLEQAESAATHWVQLSPYAVEPVLVRMRVRTARKDWSGVEADARAAIAKEPLNITARIYLAVVRHRKGDAEGGRKDAQATAELLKLRIQEQSMVIGWYQALIRDK